MGTECINKKTFYKGMTGIRGLAIVAVIFYHAFMIGGFYGLSPIADSVFGNLGKAVQLFFMISAFSLMTGYHDRLNNRDEIVSFYKRRIVKLMPLFALVLAIFVIINICVSTPTSVYEIIGTLSGWFALMPQYQESLVMAGWTIGILAIFYFIFPIINLLVDNTKKVLVFVGFSVVMYIIYTQYYGVGVELERINIFKQLPYFAIGILLYYVKERVYDFFKRKSLFFVLCVFFEILGIVLLLLGFQYLLPLSFFCMLLIQIYGNDFITTNRVSSFLGSISFELYLLHMVAYKLLYIFGYFDMLRNNFNSNYILLLLDFLPVLALTILFSLGFKKINAIFCKRRKAA